MLFCYTLLCCCWINNNNKYAPHGIVTYEKDVPKRILQRTEGTCLHFKRIEWWW